MWESSMYRNNYEQLEQCLYIFIKGGGCHPRIVLYIEGRQMLLLSEPAVECEASLSSPKVGRRSILERGRICATASQVSLQVYKRRPIVDGSRAQFDQSFVALGEEALRHC